MLTALVVLLASAVFAADDQPSQTVRVGVYQNKPKVFLDDNGRASGLFIELLTEIAQVEGWSLSFVPCQWSECLHALEHGRIDLMPDVAYSRERDQRFDFHRTLVVESWSQLYCKPDSSIHTLADVADKRVAVLQDSLQLAWFEEMMVGFGYPITIVPTESLEATFHAVRTGAADVAIANHFFGDYFHREYGLVQTPIVFQAASLHYITAEGRNQELLRAIDLHLEKWRREPNSPYYATLGRWMDRPPVGIVPKRILWIIGITIGLLVLAVGLIFMLRLQVQARARHLEKANEDLRKAEAALRKSEALLNSAQRLSRVGGWEWDIEKQEATWTEETYRIHGFEPKDTPLGSQDLMERSFACYEPEARGSLRRAFEICCEQGTSFDLEAPFRNGADQLLWVRSTAKAVRDERGKIVKILGNCMDVTERKATDDRHRQSQKLQAIGMLAGGIAHDFNNLLTVILGHADLASRHAEGNEPFRKELAEIKNAAQRAAVLTRQLLTFSRSQEVRLQPVDLNHIAKNLEKMLQRIIGENVDFQLVLAPNLSIIQADPSQLEQVIMNLVINARDAMPSGGKLTIETANRDLDEPCVAPHTEVPPGSYVVLSVTDSGCGMDEPTCSRIFEPFFTTKERGKGTGLGLSTVYSIINQSGGHITFDSQPGRGTKFDIYLPRGDSNIEVSTPEADPDTGYNGTETVLLVEDEEAVRDLAAKVLRLVGYDVMVAATAEDAVQASESHDGKIHLLLTDVMLPGRSGEELAARLSSIRPEMKVLYMSGYADERHEDDVARAQALFISKPITIKSLTRKVRETLDGC